MIDRKFIGFDLGVHTVPVEAGRLRLFNRVVGQTNPVFLDEQAARNAGYPGLPVPPTFWFSLDMEREEPFGWLDLLGVDLARVLHGMQEFTYHEPAFAGQEVTLKSRISDIFDKKGGALEFVVKETRVTDSSGRLLTDILPVENIRSFGARFSSMAQLGAALCCEGRVVEEFWEGGEKRLRLALTVVDQHGDVKLQGHAVVAA